MHGMQTKSVSLGRAAERYLVETGWRRSDGGSVGDMERIDAWKADLSGGRGQGVGGGLTVPSCCCLGIRERVTVDRLLGWR